MVDIVERLRILSEFRTVAPATTREAAEEIERLRAACADSARNCISQMAAVEELHMAITYWCDISDDLDGHPSDYHQNVAEAEEALRKVVGR